MTCEHQDFAARVCVVRLERSDTDAAIVGYTAEVGVNCSDCGEAFVFIGLPIGSLAGEPACSVDGIEARMPIRPISAPDNFGLNLLGYTVRMGE